ncbi:hypothetical protein B9Z19DRAFT_1136891 [Tuber borchii]|uniref:Uncharacterized protein n=1 Tax=Tuber borchii TaxID=42251 RepID=A0A2T6ZB71_TUBBO|nr:hypothetical protein B9Z19DRAFT_1136891 [Tuber borchii]
MSRDTGFTGIHVIILILGVVAISMIGVTWLIYKYREKKRREWALRGGQPGDLEDRGSGSSGGTNRSGGGSGGQNGSGEVAGGDGGEVVEEGEG